MACACLGCVRLESHALRLPPFLSHFLPRVTLEQLLVYACGKSVSYRNRSFVLGGIYTRPTRHWRPCATTVATLLAAGVDATRGPFLCYARTAQVCGALLAAGA
jgi:hypothetical protein